MDETAQGAPTTHKICSMQPEGEICGSPATKTIVVTVDCLGFLKEVELAVCDDCFAMLAGRCENSIGDDSNG